MNDMIGQRIKNRRKELGMSADTLAKRLKKDRSTVYRYENGDIENLPLDMLDPIAAALDTTPAYLMGWTEEDEKKEKPTVQDDGLPDNIRMLVDFAKTVPEEKAALILQVMKSIVEAD